MLDDSDDNEPSHEPRRIKEEASQRISGPSNPPSTPAKPAPTPTLPIKKEPSPSQPTISHPTESSGPSVLPPAAVDHAARSQGIPPAAKPSPRGFRKSISDPAAFHTVNSIQSRQLPPSPLNPQAGEKQGQIQDQGPWTCEAMDLFDFWPPDRLKTADL